MQVMYQMILLKEAKIPKEIDEQRRERRRQRSRKHSGQAECPSPLICGMDVPPCLELARLWAEQQDRLDRVNAKSCLDLYPDDDSPREDSKQKEDRSYGEESSLRLHWSAKELSSTAISVVLNATPTGLVPLLARCRDSSQSVDE